MRLITSLGPVLESVSLAAMEAALDEDGLMVETQVQLPVFFRGKVNARFCADPIVEHTLLVELKAGQALDRSHKQGMSYLRATPLEVGFLLDFGPKPEFKRFVFDNEAKKIRVHPRESVVGF